MVGQFEWSNTCIKTALASNVLNDSTRKVPLPKDIDSREHFLPGNTRIGTAGYHSLRQGTD